MMKSASSCTFSVTAITCLFLCVIVSLSMLCISLWLTSQGPTNYVQTMKTKLKEEGQVGKYQPGSRGFYVETTHAGPLDWEKSPDNTQTDEGFSDSWHEVRKDRTRLLTRTNCLQRLFLVILVSSSADAYKSRIVIRHTWGIDDASALRGTTCCRIASRVKPKYLVTLSRAITPKPS